MTANSLHHALLRPAVIHILRAAGFHGARPSVVDTLTDLAGRYITLLSERTLAHSFASHNDLDCDITAVRMALEDCGLLIPTRTSSEEIWAELLRMPLEGYSEQYDIRKREKERRDDEDTEGVRNFAEWFESNKYREIQRIAGFGPPEGQVPSLGPQPVREDYLTGEFVVHSFFFFFFFFYTSQLIERVNQC